MEIRQALEDLIVLQDSITWLNSEGKEDSPEAIELCERRDLLREKIIGRVEERAEQVAEVQHEIWSHWMKYLFSVSKLWGNGTVNIPAEKVQRWKRQMCTPYAELTEREKDSDREQANKVLEVLL